MITIVLAVLAGILCLVVSPLVIAGVSIARVFLKALFSASGRPTKVTLN